MSTLLNQQLLRLSELQMVQARARRAGNVAELGFIAVNETFRVLPYAQAALWLSGARSIRAASGAAVLDPSAPYVAWVGRVCRHLDDAKVGLGPLDCEKLPAALAADWEQWLPAHALWCPLDDPAGPRVGGLLLARAEPWGDGDLALADALAGAYAQSFVLAAMPKRRRALGQRVRRTERRILLGAAAAGILACGLLPVPETVLAPGEIVPADPALVRAPFAGVIDSVAVAPNAPVQAGQTVILLDRRQIATQYDVARKALAAARAEFGQASQEAVTDPKARGRVALLQSKIDEQQAEADYQRGMLDRTTITAPVAGVAVYNDPADWVGKPVETGERIMLIAPPTSATLEVQVPASAMIAVSPGAEAVFFDNVAPDYPTRGRVSYVAYASAPTAEGVLAYAVRVALEEGAAPRLGLRGTAKLYGPARPFLLWVLRKPIVTVRQWLGV